MKETWYKISQEAAAHDASLIAVSKNQSTDLIMQMYDLGQRRFGENRVQELLRKAPLLPGDIEWHLIGHLQRNKVKDTVNLVHTIHAVDSLRLLREVEKQASRVEHKVRVMLQLKIAEEDSKYGLDDRNIVETSQHAVKECRYVQIVGLMGMATFTADANQVRQEFRKLRRKFEELRRTVFSTHSEFQQLSMGMSGDYQLALAEGSTMIRVGSLLFESRSTSL